jgi:hypothetical protein
MGGGMGVRSRLGPGRGGAGRFARPGIPALRSISRISWVVALLMASLSPNRVAAQAGPPYQTDDPDPVPYRHWELYLATQDVRTGDALGGTGPQLEANYGALPGLQLHVLVPFAYARPAVGHTAYGLGDVEVGAKVRFVREGRRRPMIGTFVQTEWPAGSAAEGLATPSVHVLLPLWLQKSFGPWSTDAGGGYLVDFDNVNGDYWSMGWLVQRRLSERATLGAELYDTTAHRATAASLLANVGLVLDLTDHDQLLLSVGHSVTGPRTLQCYIGYYVTGGP